MKFSIATILIAALSFVAGMFLPWWSIAPVAFVIGLLFFQRLGYAYLAGFTGVFILWTALAWWIDIKNEGILSYKIAQLFPLGGSSFLLITITATIGGLVAGFAAMAGASLRPKKRVKRSYY